MWSATMFNRYLEECQLPYRVPLGYESDEPLIVSSIDNIKILRVFEGSREPYNPKIEQPAGPFYEFVDNRVVANYGKAPKYISQVQNELKTRINEKRVLMEKTGFLYEFPDGPGVIQTRDDTDIRNVQSVTTTALILRSEGINLQVIPFRDEGDVTHMLTPQQTIAMGLAVQEFIAGVYKWAWDKKAEIDACSTLEELDAVDLGGA